MASRLTTPHWEAPKFLFSDPNQAEEWKLFYTRVLDFLEALDIDPDVKDQNKCGWWQVKMMFKVKTARSSQTLIDNNTITSEAQRTLCLHSKQYNLY